MLALLFATAALQSISVFGQQTPSRPEECLTSDSITALVACTNTFTVRKGYYTRDTHTAAQPNATQREDWKKVIGSLLDTDGNCASTTIPSSLKEIYTIQDFQDNCVLYEKSFVPGTTTYLKGWGTMIVPRSKSAVKRDVHFSATHPGRQLHTMEQAASLFQSTHSKSFFMPGRDQDASNETSHCMKGYITDVSINTEEPYFDANVAIHEWQLHNGGCPESSCAFIQVQGKARKSCPSDMVFLSAGLARSAASIKWYTDSTPRPVKALQKSLKVSFPAWTANITLPSESNCTLTGTSNVVGRYLNGVPVSDICHTGATSETATGQFVQLEESIEARSLSLDVLGKWSQAVISAFPGA